MQFNFLYTKLRNNHFSTNCVISKLKSIKLKYERMGKLLTSSKGCKIIYKNEMYIGKFFYHESHTDFV